MATLRRLFQSFRMSIRHVRWVMRGYVALFKTSLGRFFSQRQKPHGQPYKVIVSLTSHRPRFATLSLTLECLLNQTVRPDHILLWIDEPDIPHIPADVLVMKERGLEIMTTHKNLRPYNKIIHTLRLYPDALIVTVDDDTYYQRNMVEHLLANWSGDTKEIVCNMAVDVNKPENISEKIFDNWPIIKKACYPRYDIMPFGVGGVLYPPGSLPPQTTDEALFTQLSPSADDVWLFWMARMNGVTYRKINGQPWVTSWPSSQTVGLRVENHVQSDGNDRHIRAMIQHFGWPPLTRHI